MDWLGRIAAIARKELRQLRRDRLTFGFIVGVPLIQMLLFGYAINTDVRHLRAGVADLAKTQRARFLVAAAQASQVVDVVAQVPGPVDLERLMRGGKISVGIVIPADFERRLLRNEAPMAQLMVDSSDPVVLGAAQGLATLQMPARAEPRWRVGTSNTFEVRAYYNPERRSAVEIVPGLIGVILSLTMVVFTAVAIV